MDRSDLANERDRRVLILFAKMEKARKQGRTLRLTWRELDVFWTVFGSVMKPAAEWAFGLVAATNPQPDLGDLVSHIAASLRSTGTGRSEAEEVERIAETLWQSDHPHPGDPSWAEWLSYLRDRGNPPVLCRDVDACRRRAAAIRPLPHPTAGGAE